MDTHAAMSLAPESLHTSRRSASAMKRNSSRREAHMARWWASAQSISSWVVQSFRIQNTRHGHGGGLITHYTVQTFGCQGQFQGHPDQSSQSRALVDTQGI